MKLSKYNKIVLVSILLVVLTISTNYYGSTDIYDYSDSARFFAGGYSADIRSSHSYFYGFLHSILLNIFQSYFVFKITSLIFLFILILSVYYISEKNSKA